MGIVEVMFRLDVDGLVLVAGIPDDLFQMFAGPQPARRVDFQIQRDPGMGAIAAVGADPGAENVFAFLFQHAGKIDAGRCPSLDVERDVAQVDFELPGLPGRDDAVAAVLSFCGAIHAEIAANAVELEPDGARVVAIVIVGFEMDARAVDFPGAKRQPEARAGLAIVAIRDVAIEEAEDHRLQIGGGTDTGLGVADGDAATAEQRAEGDDADGSDGQA